MTPKGYYRFWMFFIGFPFPSFFASEHYERIEINTPVNEQGVPRFTQVIFWGRYDDCSAPHVKTWAMADKVDSVIHRPGHPFPWTVLRRREDGRFETIRAREFRRTVTRTDVEEDDRLIVPVEDRR